MAGKVIIVSAPSGAGKTTIVKHLMGISDFKLAFSVSATTRPMREGEVNGRDYHFITVDRFKAMIDDNAFIEWEEVYKNCYYGTLKSEVDRIWQNGQNVLFDVDVKGGVNLKEKYGKDALAIFIMPPSIDVLRERLTSRGTESEEKINKRINKASFEIKFSRKFDVTVTNDQLSVALEETGKLVAGFLNKTS
jgi:guanylate kinase